jgi:hypothetical protein
MISTQRSKHYRNNPEQNWRIDGLAQHLVVDFFTVT